MNADNNSTGNHDQYTPHPIENETIESWTFLGDESRSTHQCSGVDNIVEHHDEDIKLSSKTSRSSNSGLS